MQKNDIKKTCTKAAFFLKSVFNSTELSRYCVCSRRIPQIRDCGNAWLLMFSGYHSNYSLDKKNYLT